MWIVDLLLVIFVQVLLRRIVFDECQFLGGKMTKTGKMAAELKAVHQRALSGKMAKNYL